MAYKKPESALVVLFDQHYRVLLLQRQDDPTFWQSVTVHWKRVTLETAYREVCEEIGIDAKAHGLVNGHDKQTNTKFVAAITSLSSWYAQHRTRIFPSNKQRFTPCLNRALAVRMGVERRSTGAFMVSL